MDQIRKTNGSAIVALIFGLLSIFAPIVRLLFAILGIYFYEKANREIVTTGEDGKSLAIVGFICSIVGFFYGLISFILFFFLSISL